MAVSGATGVAPLRPEVTVDDEEYDWILRHALPTKWSAPDLWISECDQESTRAEFESVVECVAFGMAPFAPDKECNRRTYIGGRQQAHM
jgi:hypothetical protein